MSKLKIRNSVPVAVLVLVLAYHSYAILRLQFSDDWNTWANRVRVAAEQGNTRPDVVRILGHPDEIYSAHDAIGRFTPVLQTRKPVDKVYCYTNFTWNAYIMLDREGQVVGLYMMNS